MRNFRAQRQLAREGFGEADVAEVVEPIEESVAAQVGIVDKDDQEVGGLLSEGEVLVEDTETVEGLEEQVEAIEEAGEEITPEHAETIDLVTESIAGRWVADSQKRKQAFEGFSGRRGATTLVREGIGETAGNLWNAFIEWAQGIVDSIADSYKKYFGAGKAMEKTAEKNKARLDKLGEKGEGKVKGKYQKNFTIDGSVDIEGAIAMAKSLPSEAKAVFDWAGAIAAKGENAIKLAKEDDGKKFDQVVKGEEKAKVFGKKLSRKLGPVAPKGATGETQEVYGLPGNAFLQSFQYYLNGGKDAEAITTALDGIRFINAGDSASEAKEAEKEVDVMAVDALKSHNETLGAIGAELTKIETGHKSAREESRKLLEAAKAAAKEAKSESDGKSKVRKQHAQKVAREAVFSSRHSLLAVTHVYKTVGGGISAMVAAHLGAYGKAA